MGNRRSPWILEISGGFVLITNRGNSESLIPHHAMTTKIFLSLALTSLFTLTRISSAQTLTPLVHQSPGGANLDFQLTDGTVMCQANSSQNWYKLTPDNTGS